MSSTAFKDPHTLLKGAAVVFWDFDGVIKESLTIKAEAFERLFMPYGANVSLRVRRHHESHGGLSRYDKVPLYLEWAGESPTVDRVQDFCDRFSALTRQAVVDAPWVPGVLDYLQGHHTDQRFVLVTATPEQEILLTLDDLGISGFFREIHGAPTSKTAAVRGALGRLNCEPDRALVVGDSETDLNAAVENGVPFLLRRTPFNTLLCERVSGPVFDNLAFPLQAPH